MVQPLAPAAVSLRASMPLGTIGRRLAQRACSSSRPLVGGTPVTCQARRAAGGSSVVTKHRGTLDLVSPVEEASFASVAGGDRKGLISLSRYRALVLDSSYRPIEVINWQRALLLDLVDKVDVLEYYDEVSIRSAYDQYLLPAVLRVRFFVQRRRGSVAVNRRNVFLRDHHTCQYCGAAGNTIDHVTPLSRGGDWSWSNLVCCCGACNGKKGSKTLKQLPGWKLIKQPAEPSPYDVGIVCGGFMQDINAPPTQWSQYLTPWLAGSSKRSKRQLDD